MVDFTQRINNADMVDGLNALIHLNLSLKACYENDLLDTVDDEAYRAGILEFRDLHEQHAHLLGDTVRLLGGAPDYREDKGNWISKSKALLAKLRSDKGVLHTMHTEEKRLEEEYLETLQALKASPESVTVINQAMEEREKPMHWLRAVVEGDQVGAAS